MTKANKNENNLYYKENETVVKQGKNSPVDYGIAGLFGTLGGPIGIPMSVAVIHFGAKYIGATQKWVLWFLIGCVLAPASCVAQISMMDSLIPETSEKVETSNVPNLPSSTILEQEVATPEPTVKNDPPTPPVEEDLVISQQTKEEIYILAMHIGFDSLSYSDQIAICHAFSEYGYLDIFYNAFADSWGENPPSQTLFNKVFKNICSEF